MKVIIQLFVVLLICPIASSLGQSFAPLGATWVYDYSPMWMGPNLLKGQTTYTVTGEQVVEGKMCKVILENLSGTYSQSGEKENKNVKNHYLYEEGGKVYLYNKESFLPFNLLYDFNAIKNQSWLIYGSQNACKESEEHLCKVTVDSIGLEKIDNKMLKIQYVSPSKPDKAQYYLFNGGKIINNIGGYWGFFPSPSGIMDYYDGGPLRCYTDDVNGTIKFGSTCEGKLSVSKEIDQLYNLTVIVDNDKLKITTLETAVLDLSIYSAQGMGLYNSVATITNSRYEIAISPTWKQGIYFLKIRTKDGNQNIKRFVIQ